MGGVGGGSVCHVIDHNIVIDHSIVMTTTLSSIGRVNKLGLAGGSGCHNSDHNIAIDVTIFGLQVRTYIYIYFFISYIYIYKNSRTRSFYRRSAVYQKILNGNTKQLLITRRSVSTLKYCASPTGLWGSVFLPPAKPEDRKTTLLPSYGLSPSREP